MTIPAYHMHFLFFPRPMVIIKSAFFQKCPRDHRCTNLVRVDSVPGDVGGMAVLEVIVKNGLQVDEAAAVFFSQFAGWAAAIENALAGLQVRKADYSKVEEAIKKIPADLSLYTLSLIHI